MNVEKTLVTKGVNVIHGWVIAVHYGENSVYVAIGKPNGRVKIVEFPSTLKLIVGDHVVTTKNHLEVDVSNHPLIDKVLAWKARNN